MTVKSFFYRKRVCLLVSCLFFSSCGYELRTSAGISDFSIDLSIENSELNLQLRDKLIKKKINLSPNLNEPRFKLVILQHSLERFVGSIGKAARTTQVRLDYKLSYEVHMNDAPPSIITFEDSAYIDFNQTDLLAFEDEIRIASDTFLNRAVRNLEFMILSNLNEIK